LAGKSWQLPKLGRDAWENQVACPYCGINTVVIGLDDSNNGQMYVYIGKKLRSTRSNPLNPVDAAGLTNGKLYAISVVGMPLEPTASMPEKASYRFTLVDVSAGTANDNFTELNSIVTNPALNVTQWARPEDGNWDLENPGHFYFATTASINGVTKLWRLKFSDVLRTPAAGGTVTVVKGASGGMVADNSTADQSKPVMLDNLAVHRGSVFLQVGVIIGNIR
jgi:hypothetical protein